jgi:hypothetical protein
VGNFQNQKGDIDMTEDNQNWEAPPPPETPPNLEAEQPEMSEFGTLASIFFEPGRTFEDLRKQPRFIFAMLIIIILTTTFAVLFQQRMGEERYRRAFTEMLDKNPQVQSLPPEQKKAQVDLQLKISQYGAFAIPILILIVSFIGALIYWLGAKAMGGTMGYMHGVAVWVYSSFPPTVVTVLANLVVLFLKSPDEVDIITAGQRGLVNANPTMFFDGKAMPVLSTILSSLDVFAIWGLILAAIGLRILGRISSGAAWGVVLMLTLVGITLRVVFALISGNPS